MSGPWKPSSTISPSGWRPHACKPSGSRRNERPRSKPCMEESPMAGVRKLRSGTWQGWYKHYEGQPRLLYPDTRGHQARGPRRCPGPRGRTCENSAGYLPRPDQQRATLERPIEEVIEEYHAWGAVPGGRGGRPWVPQHQWNLARQLAWWRTELHLHVLGDTLGILPSVGERPPASGRTRPQSQTL